MQQKNPGDEKTEMSASKPLEERVVELELLVTHLERDLGTLNSVLSEQRKEIDALKRLLSQLDDRVARLTDDENDTPRRCRRKTAALLTLNSRQWTWGLVPL